MDSPWNYVMNPFTAGTLADAQNGLAGNDKLIATAWEKAQISRDFGGMRAMTSNALTSYTTGAGVDRVGAISSNPDVTYVTHKDSMIQTLVIKNLDTVLPIKAGDVIEITGRNRINLDTREVVYDETGAAIPWRATVTEDTVAVAGVATVQVAGAVIFEANGQYNTIDSAPIIDDVVTILGDPEKNYQPNLFYHEQAFGLGTVKLPKLYSTDTIATTEDGLQIRVSKGASIRENKQIVRFDLRPAYAALNPFFAGHGWGS